MWCARACVHVSFIMFNNESIGCFYDSPLLPGLLLVALISLPYEVSAQSSCPCNYFTLLSSRLPSFYWPCCLQSWCHSQNVKSRVISHLAGKTNESGLMWPLVPWFPLEYLHLLESDCTQQIKACKKRAIFTLPMVSIVLWWSLGASVFSSHASGSPRDPWESANPPCEFAMCGLQWDQPAPLFFSFLAFLLLSFSFFFFWFYFMTLGFLNLPAFGYHSLWHQSNGATVWLVMRHQLSNRCSW